MKRFIIYFVTFFFFTNGLLLAQTRTDTLHIIHYDIHLSIIDFTTKKIEGYAELQTVVKVDGITKVDLDLQSLTVDSVVCCSNRLTFNHVGTRLSINLQSAVNQNDTLSLRIYYGGIPDKDATWGGFYFSGQYAYNLGVAFSAIPHSFGRVWYPCLDFFTDKSTYSCHIRTNSDKMAICGGILTDTTFLEDNTTIWHWEISEPIPTYLSSVAVGNYVVYQDEYEGIERNIPISIYAPPSYFSNIASSFINLKTILRLFENSFGPYRWERVGYVLVNFSNGAMEHAMNIAYPQFAVNGNLTYQSLYAHELAHAWFGNLMTCNRAEEMWINEGFARYSEAIVEGYFASNEDPYQDGYKVNIRDLQASVLKTAHIDDGGYWALNQVPQNMTYGATSYDKGALVVHTLRNYLGDSLFFHGIKSILERFQYQNIHSQQFFDSLSLYTGVNLLPFYEGWVNQPGFVHFSIDSIIHIDNQLYRIYIRQRLNHATQFANENKVDISLFDQHGNKKTVVFQFSGEYGEMDITFENPPLFGVIDLYEKMSDAVIDYNKTFTRAESFISEEAGFVASIQHVDSTAWLRVEHNFVAPDPPKNHSENIVMISNNHYWRIEYIANEEFAGTFSFKYKADAPNELDYPLFINGNTKDNLLLLYRRDCAHDWQIIPSIIQGNVTGMIKSTELRPGEYTLGMGNRDAAETKIINKNKISIYPNPTSQNITIYCPDYQQYKDFFIYDSVGRVVLKEQLKSEYTVINSLKFSRGYYFIKLRNRINDREISQKFIVQ